MTLLIEVAPETEAELQAEATRRGLSVSQVAGEMLDDMLQDKEDAEDARRILAETEPEEWRTLDELRAALKVNTSQVNTSQINNGQA